MISLLADDIERYSSSAEDLETIACFYHFQEIGDVQRHIHQPIVDLRVSGQPAQSALE